MLLGDHNYDCGCRVRSGVDPADGLDTSRLYTCELRDACPNAQLFIRTVEAAEREAGGVVRRFKTIGEKVPREWLPLVPEHDDSDPTGPPEPIDKRFPCGCWLKCEPPTDDAPPLMLFVACRESCATALQHIMLLKSICGDNMEVL
jgi:hypothetical protein